jgi:hypothetical protein
MVCLQVSYKKKYEEKIFFASFKSRKKGVGSISQRYGSADPDPDTVRTQQNNTYP